MVSQVERVMARRQLDAIIKSDPVTIVLVRTPKVPTGDGGWKYGTPTPLDKQTAALIPFKRRMTEFLVNTELGDLPDLPYILVGYPDLDIQKDDTFTWNGEVFEVKTVDFKKEIRVSAQVDYYGGNANG